MTSKIWNEETRTVLLSEFDGTSMEKDADQIYSKTEKYYRVKTYAKDDEKLQSLSERTFTEPYNVAHFYCGQRKNNSNYKTTSINAYNSPFIVQVGLCNLNCYYCFVSKELRQGNEENGRWTTAKEVVDWFVKEKNGIGILRISGGEPFLAPDFLMDITKEIVYRDLYHCYLVLDTNLCAPVENYIRALNYILDARIPFAVIGCIKGIDDQDFVFNTQMSSSRLSEQLSNLDIIHSEMYPKDKAYDGQLFVYLTEVTQKRLEIDVKWGISSIFSQLTLIHPNLPLRTTILKIKSYEANKEYLINSNDRFPSGTTKQLWMTLLDNNFTISDRWLPQYQVDLT